MDRKQLIEQIMQKQTFLCVGLDPDIKKIPQCIIDECKEELEDDEEYDDSLAIMAFNQAIIDATAPYCVAYKPNLAFYESLGSMGVAAYEETVAYLREYYPHHFIIADAKRGDIGNTSLPGVRRQMGDTSCADQQQRLARLPDFPYRLRRRGKRVPV